MLPNATQVVIVGAGPAGLTLAAMLAAQDIDFVLIDRLASGQNTSRAAAVHARTLEALEGIGASAALVAAGLRAPAFEVLERDTLLLTVDFSGLPTRYPYVLMLPQNETEAILARRVVELGGTIHRACEAVAMRQGATGAEVTIRPSGGPERTVRASYVVGADGYHSLVRAQAGIALSAGTYAPSFVLGDVRMDPSAGTEATRLYLSESGFLLVAPLPRGRHRLIATMDAAPEHPGPDDLQAVLNERGPGRGRLAIGDLDWSSRFRIHHGVAAAFASGRAFLVGDAAHVHSPAGGQGMNIGIQDACSLGARLATVLRGKADASVLDGYEAERRPVAQRVVAQTDRLTRLATLQGPVRRRLRNLAVEVAGQLPAVRRTLAMQFSELGD
jgi:2-polyprenyl-6-methoxyphenol hydroxylase-like FAD-dependent oxidoreductase